MLETFVILHSIYFYADGWRSVDQLSDGRPDEPQVTEILAVGGDNDTGMTITNYPVINGTDETAEGVK